MTVIQPTVGRVVWYWPYYGMRQPYAALIVRVHDDGCVALAYFDFNGIPGHAYHVLLIQDGEPKPEFEFCEWMPYQKDQAAKTEELEKDLGFYDPSGVGNAK